MEELNTIQEKLKMHEAKLDNHDKKFRSVEHSIKLFDEYIRGRLGIHTWISIFAVVLVFLVFGQVTTIYLLLKIYTQ